MITYSLTNPQKNILELQEVNSDNSSIVHIFGTLRLKGTFNPLLLQKSLNIILQKNDVFHIKFKKGKNAIVQYFENIPYQQFEMNSIDNEDISNFIKLYKELPLSLDKLYSFSFVFTPKYTYLFYKTHHIISDGWGMTQLCEQLKEVYYKLSNDEDIDSYKKPSYLDFIKREKEYYNTDRYNSDTIFWETYISNIHENKLFQYDNLFNKTSKRLEKYIPDNIFNEISNFCNRYKITEYTFFLAIFSIYFSKIYSIESIVFGTPFLNRQKKLNELENVGLFVSTLPLNISVNQDMDFVELCKNISSTNFSIYKHSQFPYQKIQNFYKDLYNNQSSLYDIGFSYQVNELLYKLPNNSTGDFKWYFLNTQNNPLTIHITIPNHKRVISYDYWISCFTDESISQMNEIIFHLISQVLGGILSIKSLNLLSSLSIYEYKNFFNSGIINNTFNTVVSTFEKVVSKHFNKIAIRCGEEEITYKELDIKSSSLSNMLLKKGIKKGNPVALCFDKSIDMIISMIATLKAGGCYVPLLPDEENSRIQYIINDSKPFCILCEKKYYDKFTNTNIPVYISNSFYTFDKSFNTHEILYTNAAYIIYTSGSTGNPKGTIVTHKNICSLMQSISKDPVLHATSDDVSMSLLKYSFDASGIDIYTSLLFGGLLILVPKSEELNPSKVLSIIEKNRVTRSFLIPKWLEHISIEDYNCSYDLSSLRILGSGGETLKPYIISHLLTKYPNLKILNLYGPTETTMFTTYKVITNKEVLENHSSIGKPIYGARLAIINSFLEILPIETKGELVIFQDDTSISNIAQGYLNLPEQTSKKFIKIYNPLLKKNVSAYRTGDLAKITINREIEFLGRNDDIVKVNGSYLVALNEVENKIQKLLGNSFESYPIAVQVKDIKIIVLFIVKKDKNISLTNVKNHINNNISFYMKPKKIIEIDSFPRNSSGKIDRKKLQSLALSYLNDSKNKIILPQTKTEKNLVNILREIVSIDVISITDDFIDDLGLDSLTLTGFYSKLEKYHISIQDIYNNSTVKDLAYLLDNKNKKSLLSINFNNISDAVILNNTKPFSLETVLLTGVTGFLGIHILRDLLLDNNTKKIYCIIRNKVDITSKNRLYLMIEFYFNSDSTLLKLINEKVIILNGDITKKNFGLESSIYYSLQKQVSTVINSAANVRHFVKPNQIRKDNVKSVENIIDFCNSTISFAHISTISIAGFKSSDSQNKIFDENTLFIDQKLDNNPYLISKFEAEKIILCAIKNKKLNATIFRIGNIMPRFSDGIFQKNATQNVFLSALDFIVKKQIISPNLLEKPIEFSPVDECSFFIVSLLKNNLPYTIYHISNSSMITFSIFKDFLSELNYKIKVINNSLFFDRLKNETNQYTKEYLLLDTMNEYSQKRTISILDSLNLKWKNIDINYIQKILNILNNEFK